MIMAGMEYRKEIPFRNVYFTGIVRDRMGRKMSKSLGNSPEPLLLIDKYGADAVRMGMLLCSPAGNDLLFDEGLIEQGRNFCNKSWNAFRLVKGWEVDDAIDQPVSSDLAIKWFRSRFARSLEEIERLYASYRLSEALMQTYKLFWDDFCSWYLEMVKPAYQKPIDRKTLDATLSFFDELLYLLHPFIPFITEEIWHLLGDRPETETIMLMPFPTSSQRKADDSLLHSFDSAVDLITAVRTVRTEKGIPAREEIELIVRPGEGVVVDETFYPIIRKLCGISGISYAKEKVSEAISFVVNTFECYIPYSVTVDHDAELEKLKEELSYTMGFLASVEKKLGNERFVHGAPPQVVETERKKKADAEARIRVLEDRIKEISIN